MPDSPTRSDRILRWGAWITAAGLLFTLVACLPLLFPSLTMPPVMWFLAMLTGVGLVVVFIGFIVAARERRPVR
jgi:hypothetical protein